MMWAPTIAVLTVSAACVAFAIWSLVHKGPLVPPRKRDDGQLFHPFFRAHPPRAIVASPPNAPARTLRNKGDAEPIDTAELLVPCHSINTKPKPKDIEADFARAKLRRSVLPTFTDELNRIEGIPLISDPTNPPDPGGWLRTPENDAPRY